jgi:single-strand DNA-binding protein
MASLNRVLLIGNLTRDPRTRPLGGSGEVCEFGMAINRRFRSATGEDREDTCFVDVDVFGRMAGVCRDNLRRGSAVYVEGRLHTDRWTDRKTGENRSRLKVVAETVQFLDRITGRNSDRADDERPARARETEPEYGYGRDAADEPEYADESVPF